MRIGSLFSGVGGLDMAVESLFDGHIAWNCEINSAASKVLAYHWPSVPNLGDISLIDWGSWSEIYPEVIVPVDILCGGFPCQDVSIAGRRKGIREGTRSGLWSVFAKAIDALQPSIVVIENVKGLLHAQAYRDVEPQEAAWGGGSDRPLLRSRMRRSGRRGV